MLFSNEREGEGYESWEGERQSGGVSLSNTTTMWGDRKEEYSALVVVRSTTPTQFVGTMNSLTVKNILMSRGGMFG